MRLVTNQWKPLTCDCVLSFSFDADAAADVRVHTPTGIVKCVAHAGLADAAAHATVGGQSQYGQFPNPGEVARLSSAMARLAGVVTERRRTRTNENGEMVEEWAPGEEPTFAFDGAGANRVLRVKVRTTAAKRRAVQDALDVEHGAGKTRIE